MTSLPGAKQRQWWDKERDRTGRPIRPDVREAAIEIWESACRRMRAELGDDADAADMLELAVEQISRYLDNLQAGPFAESAAGLLTIAFRRRMHKHATRLRRIQLAGGAGDLAGLLGATDWSDEVNRRLDLERILRHLSLRGRRIMVLRQAGYAWKQIAAHLGIAVSTAQNSFWKDLRQAYRDLQTSAESRKRKEKK